MTGAFSGKVGTGLPQKKRPLKKSGPRRLAALAIVAAFAAAVTESGAQTVTREKTPAGLAFRYVHVPEESSQVLYFAWKDGTAVAVPGQEALPTLATALIMEGPRGLSRSAMVEELRDLRATATLGAGINAVQGTLTAPREKFADAARLLARALADPALPADRLADMARNRATVSRQAESNAETLAQRLFMRLVIGDGPYQRYAISDPGIFGRVTVGDIDRWRKDVLARDGLVLVAAGPMAAAEAGSEIDRLFAGLPQAGSVPAAVAPKLRAHGKLVVLEKPVVQTAIAAGGPMTLSITPDVVRTQLAVSALGGSPSARLWLAVREKLGAAYGISAAMQPVGLDTRTLFIRTAVANDRAKDALAAIREEYARFVADGLSEAELEALKTIFVRNYRERLRRAPGIAANLLNLAMYEYPDDYLASYDQRLRGYDRTVIEAEMRAQFPKPPLTAVVIAPSAEGLAADCVIKSPEELARCD
jgi:zinc protease